MTGTADPAHPTPLKRCPTPGKEAYPTRAAALRGFVTARTVIPCRPYRCCCGSWHITTTKKKETHR